MNRRQRAIKRQLRNTLTQLKQQKNAVTSEMNAIQWCYGGLKEVPGFFRETKMGVSKNYIYKENAPEGPYEIKTHLDEERWDITEREKAVKKQLRTVREYKQKEFCQII